MDRLRADGRIPDAMAAILGRAIDPTRTHAVACPQPSAHSSGTDRHPSFVLQPQAGGGRCAACGYSVGLLGLAVAKGFAATPADAAARLEREFYGASPAANGTARPVAVPVAPAPPASSWPPSADVCAALGWTLGEVRGVPVVRAPVFDANGVECAVKVRGPRDADGRLRVFVDATPDGRREPGLLCGNRLADLEPGDLVLVCEGESDLVAAYLAAQREGIAVAVVSPSNGCGQSLAAFAPAFRGLRVAVLYDADDPGRKGGAARAAELREFAAWTCDAPPLLTPEEHARGLSDLRDALGAGRTLRDVLGAVDAARRPLAVQSFADVLASDEVEPEWFVRPLVGRRRVTLVVGQPKVGKSLTTFGLAVRLAGGLDGDWLGSPIGECAAGRNVLVVSGEGGTGLLKTRGAVLAEDASDLVGRRLHVVARRPWPKLDTPDGLRAIRQTAEEVHADLIVLDPLARFRDLSKENDNAATEELCRALREGLAEPLNCAVVLVHHPGRNGLDEMQTGSLHGGRGATVLLGEVDCAVSLRRDRKRGEVHAFFEIRDGVPIEPGRRLKLDPRTLWLDCLGDLGAQEGGGGRGVPSAPVFTDTTIAGALRDARGPINAETWAGFVGCSKRTIHGWIAKHRDDGAFEEVRGPRNSVAYVWKAGA